MTQCTTKTKRGQRCLRQAIGGTTTCLYHTNKAAKSDEERAANSRRAAADRKSAWRRGAGKEVRRAAKARNEISAERASFDAMHPDDRFEEFNMRRVVIDHQREQLAALSKRLHAAELRTAKRLHDGTCIVCGDTSPLEPLCSDACAAAHGRACADGAR